MGHISISQTNKNITAILRENGSKYFVVRNKLASIVANSTEYSR